MSAEVLSSVEDLKSRISAIQSSGTQETVLILNKNHVESEDVFVNLVRNAKACAADFDGTLHGSSQWVDIEGCYPEGLRIEARKRAAAYFSGSNRSNYGDLNSVFRNIEDLKPYLRFTEMNALAQKSKPRDGAISLLQSFDGRVVIISFGVYDYIHSWLMFNNVFAQVAGLRLTWFENRVTGYDYRSAVTDGNKGYRYDAFLAQHQLHPKDVLVIGDSPIDIGMMRPEGIGIFIIPTSNTEKWLEEYREREIETMWKKVSAVLIGNSLEPLLNMRCF